MVFKSRENFYFWNKNHVLLIQPFIQQVTESNSELIDDLDLLESYLLTNENKFELPNINSEEIEYYYRKYHLLKKHSFSNEMVDNNKLKGRLTAEFVESYLSKNKHISFSVTDTCNLNCKYCAYGEFYYDYENRANRNLTVEKAKKLINFMVKFWNSDYNMSHNSEIRISFYGGEPLLNFPFIKEMVEYTKKIKLSHNYFTYGITTNGMRIDRYMDFLAENEFWMLISLDGDKKGSGYRVLHNGKPSFPKVINNVLLLKKKFPGYFEKRVSFNSTLHRLNSVDRINKYIKKKFNKVPKISELSFVGLRESKKKKFLKLYQKIGGHLNPQIEKSLIKNGMIRRIPKGRRLLELLHINSGCVFKDYNELIFSTKKGNYIPTGTCLPLSQKMFLTSTGKILPCERVGHQHVMGHVDEKGVYIDFEGIAKKYNRIFDKLASQCSKCYNADRCPLCILQMENSDVDSKCPYFQDKESFKKFLSETMTYLEENPDLYKKIMEDVIVE
ncbi:MAG: radical SAM peptide maturase [Candidatus Aminicenantes bacterium]|nr:radical SAM peptide maturase [Candidatus Aminicenantes bacterium]